MVLLIHFLVNSVSAQNQKDSHDLEYIAEAAGDSLAKTYSTTTDPQVKLETALAIWSHIFDSRGIIRKYVTSLKSVNRKALKAFIKTEIKKPENETYHIDFALTQRLDSIEWYFQQHPEIDTADFNNRQKASLYYRTAQNIYTEDQTNTEYIGLFKKSGHYASKEKDLLWIEYSSLDFIGANQFRQHHLDTAIALFTYQKQVYHQIPTHRLGYIKGFGFYFKKNPFNAKTDMNLGMCYEKKGNLIKAGEYYQTAIDGFRQAQSNPGLNWGQSLLINTFLDLGNTQRANYLLRQLAVSLNENYDDDWALYALDKYLMEAIEEFDLDNLGNSGSLLDSVITQAEARAHHSIYKVFDKPYRQGHFLNRAKWLSLHLLIAKEHYGEPPAPSVLDSFNKWTAMSDTAKFRFSSITTQTRNSLESIGLSWQIALSESPDNSVKFKKLKELLLNRDGMVDYRYQFKMTTWILHSAGKFEEELELLLMYLPRLKEGGYIVDTRKTYQQMSLVYEGNGAKGKALEYFKLYDSLRAKTQQMNQHAQLSALDKKLEVEKIERRKADLEAENMTLTAKKTILRNFLIAAALVLFMAVLLIRNNRKRHLAEQGRKAAEMALLKQTVVDKESALDNITLDLLSSNNSYGKLIEDIEALTTNLSPENRKKARSVLVDYKAKSQNQIWQEFNLEFNRVNAGFFEKLKAKVPDLTKTELRICAMQLSGLSNQEIISITGQQLGSLYTLKSRLRKKMDVESEEEFRTFLERI